MQSPFEVLEIEPRFDIDPSALEARHKELSRALHPDRYAGRPASERRLALSKAIEVNEAYRVLRDPIRRAEAVARARSIPVGETSEPKPDPELLMEMMEAREELADAGKKKDGAKVEALAATMREREARLLAALKTAFDAKEDPKILALLGELRYVRRYLDETDALVELFENG
ncbi:MAG: Fe-S protein assembly co-chaperone HscB [Polyangiaceae bacterium]